MTGEAAMEIAMQPKWRIRDRKEAIEYLQRSQLSELSASILRCLQYATLGATQYRENWFDVPTRGIVHKWMRTCIQNTNII